MYLRNQTILALGAEMRGSFCIAKDRNIVVCEQFGNVADQNVFAKYKEMLDEVLKAKNITPNVILHDLHPAYNTTLLAKELAHKFNAELIPVQHHLAHAYSVALEHSLKDFTAIVCDGTGFGLDGSVWGGEVFSNNRRIGHLEEHYLLGAESAVNYPAKFLFSILSKSFSIESVKKEEEKEGRKEEKEEELQKIMLPFFSAAELKVLKKQLAERFNCPVTTSCGRILDAASVLLGFCREKTFDGSPAILLEQNSTEPYELNLIIKEINNEKVLMTTPVFEFLISNTHLSRQRLAATVQQYLAEGLFKIADSQKTDVRTANQNKTAAITFSGGCAYNKIMRSYLTSKGVLLNKEIPPGDDGVAFGQIGWYLENNGNSTKSKE